MSLKNDTNSLLYSSDYLSNNHGTIDSTYSSISDANEHEFRAGDKRCVSISSSRTYGLSNSFNNDDIQLKTLSLSLPSSIITIYRFKFTQEFMEELHQFSKIHYLDNRKDFKEAWTKWSEEEKKYLIEKEIKRLNDLGFYGDILDKMFKSARYYFRKKKIEAEEGVVADTVADVVTDVVAGEVKEKERHYHCCSKYLLEIMDKQIKNLLEEKDKEVEDKKPSIAFLHFCKDNKDLLKEEIESLFKLGFTDVKEIQNKIKKTYKNKYFSIIHK
jgi:hypothetical protein